VGVAELPPGGLEVAVEVGEIASGRGDVRQRADALLESLRRIVPFQAAAINLVDPVHPVQVPVVSSGYDDATYGYITSRANTDEIEMLGFTRSRSAMRLADLPVPREQIRGWAEYLQPAGFRGGLGVGLFTSDGRHLGLLAMNTDTAAHPTEASRDLIGRLAPLIASAVDPLRSIMKVAEIVGDAEAGIVLTRGGDPQPMPGLPAHPLLDPGSDVLVIAAERVANERAHGSFLFPYTADGTPHVHVRITVLAGPSDPPRLLTGVVLVSPPGDLYGLTPRELEILGLLVEGWPNSRIADDLFVTRRTVNAHVEHILAKLDSGTRTLAAARAIRFGLYVPRPLRGSGS
jgi:DNA-binding CsgD family transcriptional regulator